MFARAAYCLVHGIDVARSCTLPWGRCKGSRKLDCGGCERCFVQFKSTDGSFPLWRKPSSKTQAIMTTLPSVQMPWDHCYAATPFWRMTCQNGIHYITTNRRAPLETQVLRGGYVCSKISNNPSSCF